MTSIGEAIKKLRLEKNLSQDELANALSISRQAISNWETGKSQPDAETLLKISELFNLTVDEMINGRFAGRKKGGVSFGKGLPLFSMAISLLHFIFALLGKVNLIGVMISVMFSSIVALIMYAAFESSIHNRDFTMIAGHKKSDEANFPTYAKQLRSMSVIVSGLALLLNMVFFAAYPSVKETQMLTSLIFFFVFIAGMAAAVVLVHHKYKL